MNDAKFLSQEHAPSSFQVALKDANFELRQDIRQYLAYAELMRGLDGENARPTRNYRPHFIVPDIVAIDILVRYGIDIHSPGFMKDQAQLRRLEQIIHSEFPHLLMSNIKMV